MKNNNKKLFVCLCLLLLLGCTEKKYYPKVAPEVEIIEGYISLGDVLPKTIQLKEGWKSITVYAYGNDDRLIELPVTINGKTNYYYIRVPTNTLELYIYGWLYRVYITY